MGPIRPAEAVDREINGTGKVLMPGFVDCHTHLTMSLMRGYGGGHDLQTWLNDYIFPVEAKLDSRPSGPAQPWHWPRPSPAASHRCPTCTTSATTSSPRW